MIMPLAFARNGTLVRVVSIRAGKGLYKRLHELGIGGGKLLRVVKSLGPGPVLIEIVDGPSLMRMGDPQIFLAIDLLEEDCFLDSVLR